MAVVRASAQINMIDPIMWYGDVIYSSSSQIEISNGQKTAVFSGYGFSYWGNDVSGGTLTGFAEYDSWGQRLGITDFAVSAATATGYLDRGDLGGMYAYVLSGRDVIYGSSQSDDLAGYAGNDIINGGAGDNYISGGAGTDMATYGGRLGDHYVNLYNGYMEVISKNGFSHDRLVSVERLGFTDVVVAFDQEAAQAYRIYQAAFARTPDQAGLSYWVDYMDDGYSLLSVANNFLGSREFQQLYGSNPTNADFVDLLYQNVLGRAADAGGFNYWFDKMDSGWTRGQILANFSESNENKANVAPEIANGIFLDSWISV